MLLKRLSVIFLALSLLALTAAPLRGSSLPPPFASGEGAAMRARAIERGTPYAFAAVNDQIVDLSALFTRERDTDRSNLSADLTAYGVGLVVNATVDPDPFVSFGAASTLNSPGPVTFTFLFGTPIVPGTYNQATSTGGITLTNGASGTATVDNSANYPTYISGYGTVGMTPTNLGVDLGTGQVIASGVPFTVTTTRSFGSTSNTFAPTFYDNLEAMLTYTQTDTGSAAGWSGAVTLDIPEPVSFTAVAAGVICMGAGRAFGRRKS